MDAKTKEEIELLQELIDSPDTPQDEKELYRDTIKELKAEAEKAEKSKPEPKVEKKPETKKEDPKAKTEKKPATAKPSATKKEAPKKLPVDADKMKAEIKERTGKTEEECEGIIAEYRKLREKSKKIEAKRLGKLDDEGKLIDGTKEKTAAAVIETAAENIKDKLEKQVDKMEKDAEKGNPTPDQIEARINKNLGQLSKEMTKQATGFIKGIQSELAKADKTEAKQFLMNVRAEIDDLLSKFGGGGWLRDRRQVNQREDYETRYEKKNNTGRTSYSKKKNSVGSSFGRGGDVKWVIFNKEEDEAYESALEYYLNEGHSDLKAEKLAISDLKKEFPRLKKELVGNYKISLGTSIASEFGGGGGVESGHVYEEGVMISKPEYYFNKEGFFTVEGYAIYNKFADNYHAFFGVAKNLNISKKDALKKANAYYEYMKNVKTEDEYNKKTEEFSRNWKKQFGGGGGVEAGVQTYNITQGNMSSSSVNPSQFGEGGDIPPYEGERFSQEEFDYRLKLAKSQIISDILDGTVDPTKINDFGDLGAFVDHNYYGGFIEDDYDHSEGFVFEMSVQDALADWIEEGGITKALENPEMFAVGGSVEDAISNADARIANLRELRSVSNDDMRENLDFQIESIEREKARLLSGEVTPRKRLFGLF
jgi:uncharacterized protein YjbJ (UPF0337 family)